MNLPLFTVDAFTNEPFTGNPSAVCLLPQPINEATMQEVAREMNLSETAFILKEKGFFRLRWFTPSTEVDLCGHATLASAHVLWEQKILPARSPAVFETASGPLTAVKNADDITLDFPTEKPEPTFAPEELSAGLGVAVQEVLRNRLDLIAVLGSEKELRGLTPDYSLLSKIPGRGVIVTCKAETPDFDYLCRFFAPRAGIAEDPVTGSAQCGLGIYWKERLGKSEMKVFQASSRGGMIRVAPNIKRTLLSGQAVTVMKGEVLVRGDW